MWIFSAFPSLQRKKDLWATTLHECESSCRTASCHYSKQKAPRRKTRYDCTASVCYHPSLVTPLDEPLNSTPFSDSQNSALQWIWAALNPGHELDLAKLEHSTVQWASMKVHWWLQSKPHSGNPALFLSMWDCKLFEPLELQEAEGFWAF